MYGLSGTCLEEDEVHEQFVYGKLGGGDEIEDDVDMDDVITVTHVDLDDPHHSPSSTDMTDDTSDPGKSEIHHVHHVYSITMLLVLALGLVLRSSQVRDRAKLLLYPPPPLWIFAYNVSIILLVNTYFWLLWILYVHVCSLSCVDPVDMVIFACFNFRKFLIL